MLTLNNLKSPKGAHKNIKRIGRGQGSGWGTQAGKGHKGQKARSGGGVKLGFEGGQMPMYRRMPKRGFTNAFAKKFAEVNLDILCRFFGEGAEINMETLRAVGLAKKTSDGIRVLGRGDIECPMTIVANHFTASAKEKIEAAGGKAVLVGSTED